ncbi:MAG TPA: HAMP domain-containing sensor histidine kinase [Candidatus Acidoferrales bacterium]|nr:HAMP domain-containing sensor histidine kinase [Candidatus Acidoferrales bacterium]
MEKPTRPWWLQGKQLLKTALFVGGSLLVAAVFLFTHESVRRLSREVAATSEVLADFCAQASLPVTRDPQLRLVFGRLIENLDFPIVLTDTTGLPRAWHAVLAPQDTVPNASLDTLLAGLPVTPIYAERVRQLRRRIAEFDRLHRPIPMLQPGTRQLIGQLHYGEPTLLNRLRWMPYLTVVATGILLLLGLYGLAGIRQAEKRIIWVGMAKETAHQLGTPLSSLLGWIELLRAHVESAAPGGPVHIPRDELEGTLDDMERDVGRLRRVAQRFSHIGSAPQLQLQDVTPLVREAVQYARRRLPQSGGEIEIRERYDEVPPININRELVEWAVENLLSNAMSALDKRPGVIEVAVERRAETEEVEIVVSDNGRGMTREQQTRAFEPGYSTKRRGWGLGLALVRRVVEDYHAARISIRHSAPGQGTIMVIRFPT